MLLLNKKIKSLFFFKDSKWDRVVSFGYSEILTS